MHEESTDTNATIAGRTELHDGLCFLRIAPDSGEFPPFEPGQFVSVGCRHEETGELIKRTYSIGSSARKRDTLELFVVRVDDGEFTSWLMSKQAGARLWLEPEASGGFTLGGFRAGKNLVLIATGTGVAPYLSMYRTYRENPPWRRLALINGVRLAADLGYRQELEMVASRVENVAYIPLVTREPVASGWAGLRGRVDTVLAPETFEFLTGFALDSDECHVFLCGNPDMVDSMEALLTRRGFKSHSDSHRGTLHVEKYW